VATFKKLGKGSDDLVKANLILKDFKGNMSEVQGVFNVELTVDSKMIPTTFFIISGKGSYIILLESY
jgi:hypothetical protein